MEYWKIGWKALGKRLHSHHSILPTFHHSRGKEENSHPVRAAILGQHCNANA
jgi:hypothetical protein